jgi:transcription initiation factor TFIIIB Brf1 subunit/transcription initiation factor TFIIB
MFTDSESGEIICRNCGMVMLDNVQESRPEWRSFTTDEVNNSRSRTGMQVYLILNLCYMSRRAVIELAKYYFVLCPNACFNIYLI